MLVLISHITDDDIQVAAEDSHITADYSHTASEDVILLLGIVILLCLLYKICSLRSL
jgi:hypothetical protein